MEKKQYASPCCDLVCVCRDELMQGGLVLSLTRDPWQAEGKRQTFSLDEEDEGDSGERPSYGHVNLWEE